MTKDDCDALIGPGWKGLPPLAGALRRSAVAAMGWNVLRGDLPLPLAVIDADALAGNLRWMQNFAGTHGVDIAPHGKTSMSPQLFARQLDAGAWGITFANVIQARVGLAAGARNVLIANQVFAAADLRALQALRLEHAGCRVPFVVDSLAQVELIEAWFAQCGVLEPFEVLLELGLAGGRTGCRDAAQALSVARRLRASAALRLVGIECYEGLWASGDNPRDRALVDGLLGGAVELAGRCDAEDLFECDEVLISAGGSSVFDLVAPWLRPRLSKPVRGVLRSGCYVTHDHGGYKRLLNVMNTRLPCAHGLQGALQVWAQVQSCPEPGLAILNAGKRDVSHDQEMPHPVRWQRLGERHADAAPADWTISALNDQHAYLRWPPDAMAAPQVGDRVGLGISHPCTTFDKWRWMALVDGDCNVIDAIVTCF